MLQLSLEQEALMHRFVIKCSIFTTSSDCLVFFYALLWKDDVQGNKSVNESALFAWIRSMILISHKGP